jgi:hypothetical protein
MVLAVSELDALASLRGRYDVGLLVDLLNSQLQRPDWCALQLAFKGLEGETTPLGAYLAALQAAVRLARLRGITRWPTRYPAGAAHARLVTEALSDQPASACRERLLNLFATDLYEGGVLNLNLLKYLLVLCRHEVEERQFRGLLNLLKEGFDGSTATA